MALNQQQAVYPRVDEETLALTLNAPGVDENMHKIIVGLDEMMGAFSEAHVGLLHIPNAMAYNPLTGPFAQTILSLMPICAEAYDAIVALTVPVDENTEEGQQVIDARLTRVVNSARNIEESLSLVRFLSQVCENIREMKQASVSIETLIRERNNEQTVADADLYTFNEQMLLPAPNEEMDEDYFDNVTAYLNAYLNKLFVPVLYNELTLLEKNLPRTPQREAIRIQLNYDEYVLHYHQQIANYGQIRLRPDPIVLTLTYKINRANNYVTILIRVLQLRLSINRTLKYLIRRRVRARPLVVGLTGYKPPPRPTLAYRGQKEADEEPQPGTSGEAPRNSRARKRRR